MHDSTSPSVYVALAILASSSLTVMASAAISPGLAGLEAHFDGVDNIRTLAGLVVTLPSLFVILTASAWGWLADRFDRQKLLALAMVVYAIGGVSGLFLSSIEGILVGRAVLGLGVAGTMTLAITLAGSLFKGQALQRYMGRQSSAMAAGGMVIAMLGGVLAEQSWRYPFLIYLAAIPIALMVQHALSGAETRPAPRPAAEDGGRAPAFPWRQLLPVYGAAALFMVSFYLLPTRLPFLLTDMGIDSPTAVAACIAAATAVSIPGALLYGRLRRVMSGTGTFALGFGLMGIGLALISLAHGFAAILPGAMIAGAGMGVMMPNFSTFIMGRLPDELRGKGSGLLTLSIFGGQFVSPFASAPLEAWVGLPGTFLVFGLVLCLVALGIALVAARGSAPRMAGA